MKTIWHRLKAETPLFFKRMRTIALSVASASTGAAVFHSSLPDSFMAAIPASLISHFAVAGFVAAFIAQLTKTDK